MQLDSNTLIFSIGILSLLMAFISWTFPATITDRDFGLRVWAVGICCVGFSLIFTFLRGQLPIFFGGFLSNALLMTGGTLGLVAPARFFQVAYSRRIVAAALLFGCSGLVAYLVLGYSIAFAMIGVCFAMSVLLIYSAIVVLKNARRPIPLPAKVFAASVGLMGVAYWVRAAVVVWNPNVNVAPVSLAGSHQSMLIWGALFVVCSSISFYSMVHDEQKHLIAERARRDPLTGLFNRRAFFETAEVVEKDGRPFSIAMFDIDHFKSINDTQGHLGGDAVLVHAGRLLQGSFRLEDVVCRFGGEEFCVLIRNCDGPEALERTRRFVREFNAQTIRIPGGTDLRASISAGVSEHVSGGQLLKTIQQADHALYESKHHGRNQARLAVANSSPVPQGPAILAAQ